MKTSIYEDCERKVHFTMKKKLFIFICLMLALTLTACGRRQNAPEKVPVDPKETVTPAPTATPTPTPSPSPTVQPTPMPTPTPISTPKPVPYSLPRITKDPTAETVTVNGNCMFSAQCENANLAEWHFLSPDGSLDVDYQAVQSQFPALTVIGGSTNELTLNGIPEMFNGCKVYCKFSNSAGSVNSAPALITVTSVQEYTAPPVQHQGFIGSWVDEATGSCRINISYCTEGSVNVDVSWANSAWSRSRWQMMAYVYKDGIMVYDSSHFWIETCMDGSNFSVSSETNDGTGSLYLQDGKLHWYNDLTGQLTVLVPA